LTSGSPIFEVEVLLVGMVRVLVVDDEEILRRSMSAVVAETDGFVVVGTAVSGEDCLVVASVTRPDLVLMDINLPDLDGLETTRRLRLGAPGPIVLLLSTYAEGDVDYIGCGAAGYITKSAFGPDRLAAAWTAAGAGLGPDDRETP
jgi:DNA-binding NarL/FixJ family response regulator